MKQINIIKNGQNTNSFVGSEEQASVWLAKHETMGTFGKKEQVIKELIEVTPAVLDENFIEITPATFEEHIIQVLPAEYEIEIIDITEKLEQEEQDKVALEFLDSTDWQVLRHIRQQALGIATSLTAEEYLELEHQRQMAAESIVRI